jgi:CRISPR-associated endonuclease/helicase Cas3
MEYYAHSENSEEEKHGLSKHLHETARLSESFACRENYKGIFYITGLLHDLGKYQPDFQHYLASRGIRGSVPHASWGSGYARRNGLLEASIAIDGHHKGLPDSSVWKSDTESFKRGEAIGLEDVVRAFVADTGTDESAFRKDKSMVFAELLQREVFIRYLFSALTDSDWLSTEKHFDKPTSEIRSNVTLPISDMMGKLEEEFSKKSKEGKINRMRNEARYQVLQKAGMPPGFYSLTLPTGLGKTLTSMAWALRHARHNELKRIIIVLPFVNIIDQTAQELKRILGDDWVLEHHSSYNEGEMRAMDHEEEYSFIEQRKKLACENWDYPVIVTTTVQFF